MRFIDADAKILAQFYDEEHEEWKVRELTVADYLSYSDTAIPFVDAAIVRHGRWISVPHKRDRICSICDCDEPYKFADENANVFDYCPHCGAKMDLI